MTATVTDVQAAIEAAWAGMIPADHTAAAVLKLGYWEVTITDADGTERESHKVCTDIKAGKLEISTKPWRAHIATVELPA